MTKRDLVILVIKLFGLYSAITALFSTLPNSVMYFRQDFDATLFILVLSTFIITSGLFFLLTFKAAAVVDLLKLDKGFSGDPIDFRELKDVDIVRAGTFVIGGFIFIYNIPRFLSHMFWLFKGEIAGWPHKPEDKVNIAICALNILVGWLLLTNFNWVAGKMTKRKE